MSSSLLLKLAFKCLHHFAWPLVALVYPMCASVRAIESDSYAETKDLISYWILLSLIYLFEYAFMSLLLWFHLWLYIKLTIIFCLIIPDFEPASYVYNKIILSMKPHIVTWGLNDYWTKCFVEKDNFLMLAERYMKENGTEALEKLIASKNTMCSPDAKVRNQIIATDDKDILMTNDERYDTENKDIKDLKAIERNEIPATKQSSTQKAVQKEWTCALCLVRTKSEKDLISHLRGRRHRETMEELKAKKQPTMQKNLSEPIRMINSKIICKVCNIMLPSEDYVASHIKGWKHLSMLKVDGYLR